MPAKHAQSTRTGCHFGFTSNPGLESFERAVFHRRRAPNSSLKPTRPRSLARSLPSFTSVTPAAVRSSRVAFVAAAGAPLGGRHGKGRDGLAWALARPPHPRSNEDASL